MFMMNDLSTSWTSFLKTVFSIEVSMKNQIVDIVDCIALNVDSHGLDETTVVIILQKFLKTLFW